MDDNKMADDVESSVEKVILCSLIMFKIYIQMNNMLLSVV